MAGQLTFALCVLTTYFLYSNVRGAQDPCNKPPDPTLYFSFDNGFSGMDTIVGEPVNATAYNGPLFVPGFRSQAISLNQMANGEQYLQLGGNIGNTCIGNLLNCSSGMSLSFWLNVTRYTSRNTVFDSLGLGKGSISVYFEMSSYSKLKANFYSAAFYSLESSTSLSVGTWYHVLFLVSATGSPTLYLNGEQDASTVVYPLVQADPSSLFTIGKYNAGMQPYFGYFILDEFTIWDFIIPNAEDVYSYALEKYNCSCHSGLVVDADGCSDINECNVTNGGCEEFCFNEVGSFRCGCREGYVLSLNEFSCVDYNCSCCPGHVADADGCSGNSPIGNNSVQATGSSTVGSQECAGGELHVVFGLDVKWESSWEDNSTELPRKLRETLLNQVNKLDIWKHLPLKGSMVIFRQGGEGLVEVVLLMEFKVTQSIARLSQVARTVAAHLQKPGFQLTISGSSLTIRPPIRVEKLTVLPTTTAVVAECFLFKSLNYCLGWTCEETDALGPFFPTCRYGGTEDTIYRYLATGAAVIASICVPLLAILYCHIAVLKERVKCLMSMPNPGIPYDPYNARRWRNGFMRPSYAKCKYI